MITEKIEAWTEKALDGKPGYLMVIPARNGLLYSIENKRPEEVLTIYVVADLGKGLKPFITYDKYISNVSAPKLKLIFRESEKNSAVDNLVLMYDGVIHPFGVDEALLDDDEVEHEKPIKHMMVYFRTPRFHTWIYCDRQHRDVKRIEEMASRDELGNAAPDAVTTCMVALCGLKEEVTEEKSNMEVVPDIKLDVTGGIVWETKKNEFGLSEF